MSDLHEAYEELRKKQRREDHIRDMAASSMRVNNLSRLSSRLPRTLRECGYGEAGQVLRTLEN